MGGNLSAPPGGPDSLRPSHKSGDTIDAAIAAGATDLDRLRVLATDPSAALAKARVEAVASAALAAAQLATAADAEVASALSIVDSGFRGAAVIEQSGRSSESGPSRASTPIGLGMVEVQVTGYVEHLLS